MKDLSRRRFLQGAGALGGLAIVGGIPTLARGEDTIKVGSCFSLTGPYSVEAHDQKTGAEMAVEDINKEGGVLGRKVELLVRDDEMDAGVGKRKLLELAEKEKVHLLAGTMPAFVSLAASEMGKKYKMLNGIASTYCFGNKKQFSRHDFSANVTPYIQASTGARWSFENLGKRWHVLYDNYSWPAAVAAAYEDVAKKLGATWTGTTAAPFPTTDYTAFIPRIKAAKPEVLFIVNYADDQRSFVKQAIEFGLKRDMNVFLTISEITVAEGVSPGTYEGIYCGLTFYWEVKDKYPKAKQFVEAFEKLRGRPPTAYASSSYEVTRLLLDGINKAGTLDPDKVIKTLEGSTFQYTKGPQIIRPCDHAALGEFFICRGRSAGQMKGKWDFFEMLASVHGKDNIQSCGELGLG